MNVDPQEQSNRLGIVVVNFDSHEMVERNLTAIDPDRLGAVVVIVDNYSGDRERQRIQKVAETHSWELVTPKSNIGFGAGMNLGIAHALELGCTEVLLLNPDVDIENSALTELWSRAREEPSSILCPVLLRPDGSKWFAGGQLDRRTGRTRSRPATGDQGPDGWLSGACLIMASSLWKDIGGFDDRYFMYWEDVDLSRRCLSIGGRLIVIEDIEAVHQVGATQGAGAKSNLYAYYVCRNRLLFASIHLSRLDRLRWLAHTPVESWRIAIRDGRRSALTRPSFLLATARGTFAGASAVLVSMFRRRASATPWPPPAKLPASDASDPS